MKRMFLGMIFIFIMFIPSLLLYLSNNSDILEDIIRKIQSQISEIANPDWHKSPTIKQEVFFDICRWIIE